MSLGGGGIGGGGFGSESANPVEVDASMVGDSSITLEAGVTIQATAAMVGDSTITADVDLGNSIEADGEAFVTPNATLIAGAEVQMDGEAVLTADTIFQVTSDMDGESTVVAQPKVKYTANSTMAGSATLAANASLSIVQITAAFHGNAELSADATFLGKYGEDSYGGSPYGGAFPPYGLESATPVTTTLLRVRYTAMFDQAFPPLTQVSNYSIFPTLNIYSVIIESAQSVLLTTDPMNLGAYTLTIAAAQGYFDQPLDPDLDEVTFVGIPATPSFFAVATRKTRVRLVFSEPMLQNSALTDPSSYLLTDLDANSVSVTGATAEQTSNVLSVVLTLGEDLVDERQYVVTVQSGVQTETLNSLNPNTAMFQWVENQLRTQIPIQNFSGELIGGLLGNHAGLVFFSPALENSAADSIIQVEEVDVCTKAFDEYHFPQPVDPPVLMTHGAGVVPTPAVTTLNSNAVLWSKFPVLVDASIELEMHLEETVEPPSETSCEVTLTETWPPALVSLLNNTGWKLFDNLGNPPAYFITADNLAPFPAPTSTMTVLVMNMDGEATVGPDATVTP